MTNDSNQDIKRQSYRPNTQIFALYVLLTVESTLFVYA